MSYKRPVEFADGETLLACTVCGFPYLYPSQLVLADDRKVYCTRTCWLGETVQGHNARRAGWSPPADNDAPAPVGSKPSWR